jgi:hypothetical protein
MKNYKTLEDLMKAFETLTDETIAQIVGNENISGAALAENEKLSVLIFDELSKALTTEDRQLVLDCNFPKSKFHNRTAKQIENGLENEYLVNYFRLISNNDSVPMLHIWPRNISATKGTCTFELHITADVAPILQANEEEFHFTIKRRPNGIIRDVYRSGVTYDEIVSVVNSLCALLATNAETKAVEKKEKETAKKESKKEVKAKAVEKEEKPATRKPNGAKKKTASK